MRSISAGQDYLRREELRALRRYGNGLGFLVCAAMLGFAFYAEHKLGLAPCPLCIFQRVAVAVTCIFFLVGALHASTGFMAWIYGFLTSAAALAGTGVAARHIWIQAQPPGSVSACGASLDYMLNVMPLRDVIEKVLTASGECAKVDWSFLGLSMPWWVALLLGSLAIWALAVNWKSE